MPKLRKADDDTEEAADVRENHRPNESERNQHSRSSFSSSNLCEHHGLWSGLTTQLRQAGAMMSDCQPTRDPVLACSRIRPRSPHLSILRNELPAVIEPHARPKVERHIITTTLHKSCAAARMRMRPEANNAAM